jgi:hypothetical protein
MAPWTDGLSLLSHTISVDNDLAVILITGHGDIAMAVNAMREVRRAIAPLTDAEIDAIGEFGTPGEVSRLDALDVALVEQHCGCQMHPRGQLFLPKWRPCPGRPV